MIGVLAPKRLDSAEQSELLLSSSTERDNLLLKEKLLLRDPIITTTRALRLEQKLLNALEREPFRTQQRVLRALSALSEDHIAVHPHDSSSPDHEGWRLLAHPADQEIEKVAGSVLWWRQTSSVHLNEAEEVDVTGSSSSSKLPLLEVSSTPHVKTPPQVSSEDLVPFNPLQRWVRSPEQAMIRRAFLTQREPALLIKAAYGSGASTALAMAICDWLECHAGECVMVTSAVRQTHALIKALTPEADRVKLINPDQLIDLLLGYSVEERHAPVDPHRDQHTECHNAYPARVLLYGGRRLARPSLDEWSAWEQWARDHASLLGTWSTSLYELRRLILQHVFCSGDPRRQENLLSKPALNDLPPDRKERLSAISESVWLSTLGRAHRQLYQNPPQSWPWPEARALIIDDCLELSWPVLYSTLRFADEHLGASGRRWTLALSGIARDDMSTSGLGWSDLETLVKGGLGRDVHPIRLTYSERLPAMKSRGLRVLSKSLKYDHLVGSTLRQLPSGVIALSNDQHHTYTEPLWVVEGQLSAQLEELETLELVMKTCLATPGAYLLDLPTTPQAALRLRIQHLKEQGHFSLPHDADRLLIDLSDLDELEAQWLIVYQPQLKFLPSASEPALTPDRLEELWYLLTRTPTPLLWIGTPPMWTQPPNREIAEALTHISQQSPWGGLSLFTDLERARALSQAHETEDALALWFKLKSSLSAVLGLSGALQAEEEIYRLHLEHLKEALHKELWGELEERVTRLRTLKPLSASQKPVTYAHHTSADQEISYELSVTLKEQIQAGEEAISNRDLLRFHEVLSATLSLARALTLCQEDCGGYIPTIWSWSERILDAPIPQADVQSSILSLLAILDPQAQEYTALLDGYRSSPSPHTLSESAHRYLELSPPTTPRGEQRGSWGLKHLTRWLMYLLEPRRSEPWPSLPPATVALGFALVSARAGLWRRASRLASIATGHALDISPLHAHEVSASPGERSISRSEPQPAPAPATHALEFQKQWEYALREVYAQRDQFDIERGLREEGDLSQLKSYYQKTHRAPPPELELAFRLDEVIEALTSHWPQLSLAERAYLSQKWGALEAIDVSSIKPQL